MRIIKHKKNDGMEPAKYINFTVDDPNTYERIYHAKMTRKEATDAVEYLRVHNGNAPATVHALIDGLELALSLKIPEWKNK
jgi:hypothetical protein